jgi:glucose/arabinose dehydrogenase
MLNFYSGRQRITILLFAITCAHFCQSSFSQEGFKLTTVISGLSSPVQLVNAGDGSNRIFVVEKAGNIKVFGADYTGGTVLLTVSPLSTADERGLLSIAFHPNYSTNGYIYAYYVNPGGNLELARYHVSADASRADPGSKTVFFSIPHPGATNHNGGELHFGPDGYLYISTGDGGGTGDVSNNAQNTSSLLGKILRIDVDNPADDLNYSIPVTNPFHNEIFALGLRNPFRWSFDRGTGDIWIGDVGQDSFEEIDRIRSPQGGENFGWRCFEGDAVYNNSVCNSNYQNAFYTYPTTDPAASVIGGVVYRGNRFPALKGYYIAADFFTGNFYKLDPAGGATIQKGLVTGVADFGEAENGEVYAVLYSSGTIQMVMDAQEGPLPVTLTAFRATAIDNTVNLSWQTASEVNLAGYDIEMSRDGNSFERVGTVAAKNSLDGDRYEYPHIPGLLGTLYYRLKMIDADGRFSFSQTAAVNLNPDQSKGFIFPSLIRNGQQLSAWLPEGFETLELSTMAGVRLRVINLSGRPGRMDVGILFPQAGIYIARIKNRQTSIIQKIIVAD